MENVKITQMKDGDKADYDFLTKHEVEHTRGTADRLLKALVELDEGLSGYKITRLGHSLQSATRAWNGGADIDWVVSALLHDIGDIFAPYNHDEYAATILKPFVREQCRWVVEKHGDFQLVYYGEHVGANPNKRDAFTGHEFFNDCAYFCEHWDQNSFDPDYETLPITFFAPMVRDVFAREPNDPLIMNAEPRPLSDETVARIRAL
jgi:predicted HD phosphohydrolase